VSLNNISVPKVDQNSYAKMPFMPKATSADLSRLLLEEIHKEPLKNSIKYHPYLGSPEALFHPSQEFTPEGPQD